MHDAHFHLSKEMEALLLGQGFQGIVNTQSPEEYCKARSLSARSPGIVISAGIHPWTADDMEFGDLEEVLSAAPIVGEIGLDSVWCSCDMERQRSLFKRQLAYAARAKKPVILHTKGMEEEIADTIREYPNTYLVHWYSSEKYLEKYLELDCYFTLGPAVGIDPAVDSVCKKTPLNRLLMESDGIGAFSWASGKDRESVDYDYEMRANLSRAAAIREMDAREFEKILDGNYRCFLGEIKA